VTYRSTDEVESLLKKLKQQKEYISKFGEWKAVYKKELKEA